MYDPMECMEWLNDPQSSSENIKNEIATSQQDIPDIYLPGPWTNPQPTQTIPISKPAPPKIGVNVGPPPMMKPLPHMQPLNPSMVVRECLFC